MYKEEKIEIIWDYVKELTVEHGKLCATRPFSWSEANKVAERVARRFLSKERYSNSGQPYELIKHPLFREFYNRNCDKELYQCTGELMNILHKIVNPIEVVGTIDASKGEVMGKVSIGDDGYLRIALSSTNPTEEQGEIKS